MRALIVLIAVALLIPQAALAIITFDQLDDDIFVISHRVKLIGSRGQAQRVVYEKAASVCVAAGYSYFKILDQESQASQQYEAANASIRVQFYQVDSEGRIGCEKNASGEYIEQARAKLARTGYRPPPEPSSEEPMAAGQMAGEDGGEASGEAKTCTVEQIAAMVRAGLTDEQIKAACPE